MKCPKCGYVRQASDNRFAPATECPACGVVYSKTGSNTSFKPMAAAPIKKPSPLNEETLKRARERVEMRLRKQMEADQSDEQREQTLQRARVFAADGVRQRQEAWKRQKVSGKNVPDDLTMSEAAIRVKDPTADLDAFKGGALTMFGVVRPQMGAKEMNDEKSPGHSDRGTDPSVSLSDSLSQRPPGDDLADDTHPSHSSPPEKAPAAAQAAAVSVAQAAREKEVAPSTAERPPGVARESDKKAVAAPSREIEKTFPTDTGSDNTVKEPVAALKVEAESYASDDEAQGTKKEAPAPAVDTSREERPELPAYIANAASQQPGRGLMRLLPTVAWLILVAGLVGAVLSWTTLNDVQANMDGPASIGSNAIPIALLLGFAYLATGVLGFAFFWVCSIVSGQLKDIQTAIEMRAASMDSETKPT